YEAGAERRSAEAIRSQLGRQLPDYMVPSVIVELKALPLTAHGKVDRKALPRPVVEASRYEAPQTGTEQMLAGIWEPLLEIPRVSRTDHFFAAGGHAPLATQLVSRVRSMMGIGLRLRQIFEMSMRGQQAPDID